MLRGRNPRHEGLQSLGVRVAREAATRQPNRFPKSAIARTVHQLSTQERRSRYFIADRVDEPAHPELTELQGQVGALDGDGSEHVRTPRAYRNSLDSAERRMVMKGAPSGLAVGTRKAPLSSFFVRVRSPSSSTR